MGGVIATCVCTSFLRQTDDNPVAVNVLGVSNQRLQKPVPSVKATET